MDEQRVILDIREALLGTFDIAKHLGVSISTKWVCKTYARHLWDTDPNRKPYTIYRGGRWRQMREEQRVQARYWALVESDKATDYG